MLRSFIHGLVDIIYPRNCLICKINLKGISNIDNLVCSQCWQKFKRNLPPFCRSCGRQLKKINFTQHICSSCVRKKLNFDRAFSPCVYEGAVKELIHQFKYKGKDYLGNTLGGLMVEFIKEYNLPMDYIDFIVPMPLHKTRLREREFNQAEILASYIAHEFKKNLLVKNLIRHRPTKTQTELEEKERFLNVKGSFLLKDGECLKGKNILLIDDVLTTAATSSEAAHTLKDAGTGMVLVLTLAN